MREVFDIDRPPIDLIILLGILTQLSKRPCPWLQGVSPQAQRHMYIWLNEFKRLISSARVINNEITFDIKDATQVYEVYHTRFTLHKSIYNHKTGAFHCNMISFLVIMQCIFWHSEGNWVHDCGRTAGCRTSFEHRETDIWCQHRIGNGCWQLHSRKNVIDECFPILTLSSVSRKTCCSCEDIMWLFCFSNEYAKCIPTGSCSVAKRIFFLEHNEWHPSS